SFVATGRSAASLVRRTPVLLLILAISASWGAWSEAYDRLGLAHLIRDIDLPSFGGFSYVLWFGAIAAASLVLSLLVATRLNARLERASRRTVTRTLLIANVALIVTVWAFALA